jgi:hypothetical protein
METKEESDRFILIEQVKALNITNNDFNILKAEIEVINDIDKQRMICSIKYQKPGKYLLSIRSTAGIEAARVFITEDTVMINDRLSKKLYYGDPDYLLDKYGITVDVIPVILGDFVSGISSNEKSECKNGEAIIRKTEGYRELIYTVDCKKKKITDIKSLSQETGKGIVIRFKKFEETERNTIPKNIEITDSTDETRINITIEKIREGLENEIKFIPGKDYEMVLLK